MQAHGPGPGLTTAGPMIALINAPTNAKPDSYTTAGSAGAWLQVTAFRWHCTVPSQSRNLLDTSATPEKVADAMQSRGDAPVTRPHEYEVKNWAVLKALACTRHHATCTHCKDRVQPV